MPMKIVIDEFTSDELPSQWKLSAQKRENDCIHLRIGDHDSEANIVVSAKELVRMINILIDLK